MIQISRFPETAEDQTIFGANWAALTVEEKRKSDDARIPKSIA